jgi:hypothetical protein
MFDVGSFNTERIIRSVEAEGSELTSNKMALATCIQISAEWYSEALKYTSRRSEKMQQTASRRLQAAANELLLQLKNDRSEFYRSFVVNSDQLAKQLSNLSHGIETALRLQPDTVPSSGREYDLVEILAYRAHFKARSPLEWLAGVYLIETFALNFRVAKGTLLKNYTVFAIAVLKELKIKNGSSNYSAESIRRAARGGRDRRKVKKVDDMQFIAERQMHLYAACGRHWKREALKRTLEDLGLSEL